MKKKTKYTIWSIIFVLWITLLLSFISIVKLWVYNPFMSIYWFTQITFFDKDFVKLQDNPEVYIAKPNPKDSSPFDMLVHYIESKWYEYLEDKRMSSLLVFKKENKDYVMHVNFKTNKYYTLWTNFTKLIE